MFTALGLRPSQNGFRLEQTREPQDPVNEGYEMLAEMEMQSFNIIHDHVYSTYTGTRESSMDIIMEGLGDMISSAAKFFKELIIKLIEFFKKSAIYMASLFMNFDKFIERYKDELTKANKEYSLYGFEYDFSHKIPKTDIMMGIVSEFNSEIPEITKLKKEDLVRRRDDFLNEGKLDLTRAAIIGKTTPVEASEFRTTVQEMFRKGQDSQKEIKIDSAKLRQYMSEYPKLKKEMDEVKKDRFKLEKVYRSLETFFSRGPRVEYVGSQKKIRTQTLDVDMKNRKFSTSDDLINNDNNSKNLDVINYYYSFKWKQAQEISTYSFQAYVERVNALKEAVKFYEKVIRGAIFAAPVDKEA